MQVILLAAISADGKIAQQQDQVSLDWTSKEDTQFFVEKTKEIGLVIMGRKTFETIGKPLKDRRVIVMTREVDATKQVPGVLEFTDESPKALLDRLEQEGHDRVVVAGGSSIYSQFLREGLVTELYLTVEPVLFGSGILFTHEMNRMDLNLIETRMLGSQSVLLHYRIKKSSL